MRRAVIGDRPSEATSHKGCASNGAERRRLPILRAVLFRGFLVTGVLVAALDGSAIAGPGSGYGDLIDNYCIDRGRLRIRAHEGHCAMCHQQGTFDQVEPNWTEYVRGRSSGDFSFFCPASTESPSASQTVAGSSAPAAPPPTGASTQRGIAGPMGMPPAEVATPATPAETAPGLAMQGATPGAAPQGGAASPEGIGTTQPRAAEPRLLTSVESTARLTALHDSIGISQRQEPAWREFIDAVAAAARRQPEVAPATGEPTAQLRAREGDLSGRIDALRTVGTALSRLRATLDEAQQGALSEGVAQLLDAIAEGKLPPQITLGWFKGQMNLAPDTLTQDTAGPLGLSWFHAITMSLVTAFAGAMLAMYVVRTRRANALVDRLTSVPLVSSTPARRAATSAAPSSPAVVVNSATAMPLLAYSAPAAKTAPSTGASSAAAPALARTPARGELWKGELRVAAIFRETPLVKTFRFRDPHGGPIPFTFLPGQFLTFSVEIDGKRVRRSYTIASSATQMTYVDATIKREDAGVFSDYMHDKIVEGDLIDVIGPSGVFTFRGTEAESLVLIGGGVGITPLMAVIRYLADTVWPGEIFLVYGARSTEEFIFREELEYRQRRMRNLHVAATMARSEGTSWMGPEGPITKEFLTHSVPDIAKRHVHLCGPPGMMRAMKKILAELGLPAEQVMTEAFGPAMGAVPPPGVTEVTPIESFAGHAADAAAPPSTTNAPTIGPATASIRFSKSNKDVPLAPDRSVLEVAESVGVPIDYQCRVGTCGVCKIQLLEGKVIMEVEEALTPEDKVQNIILACQAKSIGNLVVEA